MQKTRVLTESDVLRLIVNSKLPGAVDFERWVSEGVLSQIHCANGYAAPLAPPLSVSALRTAGSSGGDGPTSL
jgi:anti-repressor protein